MPNIAELNEEVWSRVAAGEVVERPASAVKELVENSIDAQAKRIRVSLKDGGRLSIIVEDDGTGIAFDELPLALTYHATSKIATLDDLEHIMTLGYRGEALASLAAVSDVELTSRQRDSEQGGIIRTENGSIVEHIPANCPQGTRVKIENLFSGLPARRKFLKSASGELRRCAVFLREYAVCNPQIAFTLTHDGKNIFSSDGAGDRKRVLAKIWGSGPDIQNVSAKAGHTELECWFQARAGLSVRGDTMAFVNGRAVNDPVIKSAVSQAARDLAGNFALFFSLDPSLVDVNIHPAKSEVRFRYNNEIYDSVHECVKHLGSPMPLPEIISVPAKAPAPVRASSPALASAPAPARVSAPAPAPASSGWKFSDTPADVAEMFAVPQTEPAPEQTADKTPEAAYLGQSSGGYLVYDDGTAIILIDPHAAHERVNYERIKSLAESSHSTQKLLVPVMLHPTLALDVHEHEHELAASGFLFGKTIQGVELQAVPAVGDVEFEPEVLLRASLDALRHNRNGDTKSLLWRTWATMACKASVKLTSRLSEQEALALWQELHECEQPNTCPHGRPTMIELKNSDLLKRFGRE